MIMLLETHSKGVQSYIVIVNINDVVLLDIYGKCRTMNPSTTSTGNIQGWSQKK
jgi:hypothetical protein